MKLAGHHIRRKVFVEMDDNADIKVRIVRSPRRMQKRVIQGPVGKSSISRKALHHAFEALDMVKLRTERKKPTRHAFVALATS